MYTIAVDKDVVDDKKKKNEETRINPNKVLLLYNHEHKQIIIIFTPASQ